MSDPLSKFWMVWAPRRRDPVYQHQSKAAARKEAERLAGVCPGCVFFVLAAVDAVLAPVKPPETVKLTKPKLRTPDDDIPF